jgi:hypothetical protein
MSESYSPRNDPQFDPIRNPTEREYHLRAKVWVIETYAQQGQKGGSEKVRAVALIPQDGDESAKFFNAWLPDGNDHIVEVLCRMGAPIFGSARCAVRRPDKNYPHGPHLFVMHKWLEDILNRKNLQTIEFTTMPGTDDANDIHESDMRDTITEVLR